MAQLNTEKTHIVFTRDESESDFCPICSAGLDFNGRVFKEDEITDSWHCPECKASGSRKSRIGFISHLVQKDSIPKDSREQYIPQQAECLNGVFRVGSHVLLMTENPCLVGKVTAIEPVSLDGSCDVHVDCSFDYSADRVTDIENRSLYLNGRYITFEEMELAKVVISANQLLCLDHLSAFDICSARDSEETALRYACQLMYGILNSKEKKENDE